jgi:hypothetical protein
MSQHFHQYEYREPQPRNSELVRERLRERPRKTFETVADAVAWHEGWINEVPRPAGYWGTDGEAVRKPVLLDFVRHQLEHGNVVVDSFWSGPQVIAVTHIPCPLRPIPGFPDPPPCPLGRK